VQHGRNIERAPVALRRLETNVFSGVHGRIIKTVSQTADNAPHADLAVGGEINFQKDVAFNVTAARFVGIDRIRFADDLDSAVSVITRAATRAAARRYRGGVTEAAGANQTVTATTRAAGSGGDAIAEAGAGNCS
jgi:hypothetical protein